MRRPNLRSLFSFALLILATSGCVGTRVNVIDKDRDLSKYDQVFVITPPQDPRKAVPRIRDAFIAQEMPATVLDKDSRYKSSQGTAFFITKEGHLLTSLHVMEGSDYGTIWLNGSRLYANVISSSTALDLALLKVRSSDTVSTAPLRFSSSRDLTMGEKVYTIGYPLTSMLGSQPRLSEGLVSAAVGARDNPDFLQITAAIQPGNSGGPLLDAKGHILGVIQQSINPGRVLVESGNLPQNVNFALKSDKALEFLRSTMTPHVPVLIAEKASVPLNAAQKSIVRINAGEVPPDEQMDRILVVVVNYLSRWDIYHKFLGFELSFFDYKTKDLLFTAGQYDNYMTMNPEGYTIRETVRKALEKIRGKAPGKT